MFMINHHDHLRGGVSYLHPYRTLRLYLPCKQSTTVKFHLNYKETTLTLQRSMGEEMIKLNPLISPTHVYLEPLFIEAS